MCPLTKRGRKWVGSGIQIIDALDTLFIAGLTDEYNDGIKWIETSLDFNKELNDHLPLFEVYNSCCYLLFVLKDAKGNDSSFGWFARSSRS